MFDSGGVAIAEPRHLDALVPGAPASSSSRTFADEMASWEPSALVAALVEHAELDQMRDDELVETVALWGRIAAWAQAHQARAAAVLDARPAMRPNWPDRLGRVAEPHVTAEELAARLSCSRTAARELVRQARAYDGALEMTGEALATGAIDAAKARVLVRALDGVAVEVAALVQEEVLPHAPRLTPRQLSDRIEKALLEVDPEDAEHRAAKAVAERRVNRPRHLPNGMAGIWTVLPAPAALAVSAELDLTARALRAAGDERTLDQLRADTFVTAVLARHLADEVVPADDDDRPPSEVVEPARGEESARPALARERLLDSPGGATRITPIARTARHLARTPVRAHIQVTVPLDVLLDRSEAPASLEGYGAIPAATARALARGGTWARLVTDPLSGMVHDVGRTRYRPPQDMARHVRARDVTCVRPGCSTSARACELDHTVPFGDPASPDGGRTATDNLGPLCPRDHLLKTHAGFGLVQDAPGVFTWITPTGRRVQRDPVPVGPARTEATSDAERLTVIRSYVDTALGMDEPPDAPPAPPPGEPPPPF